MLNPFRTLCDKPSLMYEVYSLSGCTACPAGSDGSVPGKGSGGSVYGILVNAVFSVLRSLVYLYLPSIMLHASNCIHGEGEAIVGYLLIVIVNNTVL